MVKKLLTQRPAAYIVERKTNSIIAIITLTSFHHHHHHRRRHLCRFQRRANCPERHQTSLCCERYDALYRPDHNPDSPTHATHSLNITARSRGPGPAINFSLSKNSRRVGKFSSENTKCGAGNPPFLENLGVNLKFRAPTISSVGNVCLTTATSRPLIFKRPLLNMYSTAN